MFKFFYIFIYRFQSWQKLTSLITIQDEVGAKIQHIIEKLQKSDHQATNDNERDRIDKDSPKSIKKSLEQILEKDYAPTYNPKMFNRFKQFLQNIVKRNWWWMYAHVKQKKS